MTSIDSFFKRLRKIGIEITMSGNYPWVYLDTVNGNRVKEKLHSNHGFTIFFRAIRPGEKDKLTDISLIFKTIRKNL